MFRSCLAGRVDRREFLTESYRAHSAGEIHQEDPRESEGARRSDSFPRLS